jgi:hypothetical protein
MGVSLLDSASARLFCEKAAKKENAGAERNACREEKSKNPMFKKGGGAEGRNFKT